ncbi:MAG: repeat protein [Myxococcaceae bacterium]|nr:repeat protein [Myxococcaceae bacterium]
MNWLLPPLAPNFGAALRDVHAVRAESRMAAAERLGRAEGAELEPAITGLSELAADVHPGVRATALAALGLIGGEEQLDVVLAAFDDEAPEVRELAAVAAAQIGGEAALTYLTRALQSEQPEVRFQAVSGVAELAPDEASALLLPLLSDPDAEVRAQVIGSLAELGEPHLAGHLAHALGDRSDDVRLEAALALARLGDPRAEAPLLQALYARNRVADVARALSQLGCIKACDPIAEIAGSFFLPPHLRAELGAALVKLGDPRGAPALKRVLSGLRSDARSYAVELAREVDAQDVVPELARLATRLRGVDPFTLVEALANFAERAPEASSALARLAQRGDAVGEAARRAVLCSRTQESAPTR